MNVLLTLAALCPVATMAATIEKPNILVLVCEDISPYLHCYGDPVAISPAIDRLAASGIRHTNMYTTINGGPIPRGKREIMDSGSHVPFIIVFPDGWPDRL